MAHREATPHTPVTAMHALLGRLLDESHELTPREIGPLLERELGALGFADVGIFLADHEQRKLVPIAPWSDREPHRIDSTLPGRVYQAARSAKVGATPERLWVPIRDGVDRLGVLLFARSTIAEDLVRACEQLAALVAQFLVSKNQIHRTNSRSRVASTTTCHSAPKSVGRCSRSASRVTGSMSQRHSNPRTTCAATRSTTR